MKRFRALAIAGLSVLALAAITAGAAFAGEVTGSGKYVAGSETAALHGASDCAYSGLNDNYVFGTAGPGNPDADGFGRTQNWGQLGPAGRAFLTSIGLSPGVACNPATSSAGG